MKALLFIASVCIAICAGLQAEFDTSSAQPRIRDIGSEVRGLFAAKCAGCHGAELTKPEGRFGYVLDLQRVANNPELVIPGRSQESELWQLIQHNEMPPSDSPFGTLTQRQKELIREWIATGTPEPTIARRDHQGCP